MSHWSTVSKKIQCFHPRSSLIPFVQPSEPVFHKGLSKRNCFSKPSIYHRGINQSFSQKIKEGLGHSYNMHSFPIRGDSVLKRCFKKKTALWLSPFPSQEQAKENIVGRGRTPSDVLMQPFSAAALKLFLTLLICYFGSNSRYG